MSVIKEKTSLWLVTYGSHSIGPLAMSTLKHFDSLQVGADLNHVADSKLLLGRLVEAFDVGRRGNLRQYRWVKSPAISAIIRNHNIMVFVYAHYRTRVTQTLKHP